MKITVNGIEYSVSCIWHQNDTIVYYVEIDGNKIKLDLDMHKGLHDSECHIKEKNVRFILKTQIKLIISKSNSIMRKTSK